METNLTENKCICCGEVIPEGRIICPNCELKLEVYSNENREGS